MDNALPSAASAGAPAAPRRRASQDEAGRRRRAALAAARLYVCVDLSRDLPDLLAFADAAFRGGVDILQVRDKSAESRAEVEALRALRPVADAHGALLAANDRADVAVLAGVDVLHLGQGDLTTADARALVGSEVLVGRSTRTEEQMHEAASDPGIDYFCTGPVWATPTKPDRAPVGLDLPRAAARAEAEPAGAGEDPAASKPFFAIGGIDLARVPEVLAVGAQRIVVVRAVAEAADPEAAARALRDALTAEA
ncbi:thiamine phosphate synthase [Brachybacterium sp. FME24]|uniref:thiamine phosphate synthase n=1 Tax=Brachybacterium sp. FME24 TaxID=2742605 RepID=UPI001867478B|nr:thiamine phosphate synthase [Brachybacterium sp. FME24]